jgi:hypothetical protein
MLSARYVGDQVRVQAVYDEPAIEAATAAALAARAAGQVADMVTAVLTDGCPAS